MSDSNNNLTFQPTLELYLHPNASPADKRSYAVNAALELIKADLLTARERNTTTLERHLSKLDEYASTIQNAIDNHS